jgi:serine/threonine protein kinase
MFSGGTPRKSCIGQLPHPGTPRLCSCSFRDLNASIRKLSLKLRPHTLPKFTGKTWARGTQEQVVHKRLPKLRSYLQGVLELTEPYPAIKQLLVAFLRHDDAETAAAPSPATDKSVVTSGQLCAMCRRPVSSPIAGAGGSVYCSTKCANFLTEMIKSGFSVTEQRGKMVMTDTHRPRSVSSIPLGGAPPPSAGAVTRPTLDKSTPSARRLLQAVSDSPASADGVRLFRASDAADRFRELDVDPARTTAASSPTVRLLKHTGSFNHSASSPSERFSSPASLPLGADGRQKRSMLAALGDSMRALRTHTDNEEGGKPSAIGSGNFLWKRGGWRGGRQNWKRRFFCIVERSLHYYQDNSTTLLGTMPLVGGAVERPGVFSTGKAFYARVRALADRDAAKLALPSKLSNLGGPYAFSVETPSRTLYLCAESATERDGWISAIESLIEQQRAEHSELRRDVVSPPQPGYVSPPAHWAGMHPTSPDSSTMPSPTLYGDSPASALSPQRPPIVRNQSTRMWRERTTLRDVVTMGRAVSTSDIGSADAAPSRLLAEATLMTDRRHSEISGEATATKADTADRRATTDGTRNVKEAWEPPEVPSRPASPPEQGPATPPSEPVLKQEDETPPAPEGADTDELDLPAISSRAWEVAEEEIEITDRIGEGAFGDVYRGRLWGTDVAVKLIRTGGNELGHKALQALQAEVAILSQLRHPNVVLYLGAGTRPPSLFVVTEWCERGSLNTLIYDESLPISASARSRLALHAAQGMCYLHSPRKRIVHRDLKSLNLLLTRHYVLKVADFGLTIFRGELAKAAHEPNRAVSQDEGDTAEGTVGTPQWMAPEVLEGERYDEKVDIYSFGVILAELFSRIEPFSDRFKRWEFVDRVLEDGAAPTMPLWVDTPPQAPDLAKLDAQLQQDELQTLLAGQLSPPTTPRVISAVPKFLSTNRTRSATTSDLKSSPSPALCGPATPQLPPGTGFRMRRQQSATPFARLSLQGLSKALEVNSGIEDTANNSGDDESDAGMSDHGSQGRATVNLETVSAQQQREALLKYPRLPLWWRLDADYCEAVKTGIADARTVAEAVAAQKVKRHSRVQRSGSITAMTPSATPVLRMPLPPLPSSHGGVGSTIAFAVDDAEDLRCLPHHAVAVAGAEVPAGLRAAAKRAQSQLLPSCDGVRFPSQLLPDDHVPPCWRWLPGRAEEWCSRTGESSGVVQLLSTACLSRDPEKRPAFEEIGDLLGALLASPQGQFFLELEVPRLREELAYGSALVQCRAAAEVLHASTHALLAAAGRAGGTHSSLPSPIHSGPPPLASSDDVSGVWSPGTEPGAITPVPVVSRAPIASPLLRAVLSDPPALPRRASSGVASTASSDPLWALAELPFAFASSLGSTVNPSGLPSAVFAAEPRCPVAVCDLAALRDGAGELLAGLTGAMRTHDVMLRTVARLPAAAEVSDATLVQLWSLLPQGVFDPVHVSRGGVGDLPGSPRRRRTISGGGISTLELEAVVEGSQTVVVPVRKSPEPEISSRGKVPLLKVKEGNGPTVTESCSVLFRCARATAVLLRTACAQPVGEKDENGALWGVQNTGERGSGIWTRLSDVVLPSLSRLAHALSTIVFSSISSGDGSSGGCLPLVATPQLVDGSAAALAACWSACQDVRGRVLLAFTVAHTAAHVAAMHSSSPESARARADGLLSLRLSDVRSSLRPGELRDAASQVLERVFRFE